MRPEMPGPISETGNVEDVRTSDAATPSRPAPRVQRRPLRLIHLMALVAALAVTLVVPPFLMKLISQPILSGWGWGEQLAYKTSLALTFWTPTIAVIAVIVVIRNRSRVGRVSRSYGTSAVVAEAAAIFLLSIRGLSSQLLGWYLRGIPVFPDTESYFNPNTWRLVSDAPAAAAAATVAAWLILALTGVGRRPSDWFDRFCLLFGLLWVFFYVGRDLVLNPPWLW